MNEINLPAIKEFMILNKLSEQEMAVKMGISHSYLFRVLQGTRKPGRKFIQGMLNAGMKVDDIFLTNSFPKGNTPPMPTGTC